MEKLIEYIIKSYNSLWKIKKHGNTFEIITPIATTSNIFVSVFLTRRGDDFIVTDGGWIDSGMYECDAHSDDIYYFKIFQYYLEDYEIDILEHAGYHYYYKKIEKAELVPNIVYDLSSFINAVVSASFISFEEKKEKEQIGRFKRNATNFIHNLVDKEHLKTNYSIHEGLAIKFNAVVLRNNRMTLINYVTGSNDTNFILSLGRSNLNYDAVDAHAINSRINHKITLIDDTTKSIQSPKIAPYLKSIETKSGRTYLKWHEKSHLKELVE